MTIKMYLSWVAGLDKITVKMIKHVGTLID